MRTTPQTPAPTTARTPTPSYEEFAAAKARILGAGMAPGESSEERRSFEAVGANVAAEHANVAADQANVAADHDLADMSRTPS